MDRKFEEGDIVKHFKRETLSKEELLKDKHLYKIITIDAIHTETNERCVVYQALYEPYNIFVRPYEMFISKVDKEKYPNIKQEYRIEKLTHEDISEISSLIS